MTTLTASDFLQLAEAQDGYRAACERNHWNRQARAGGLYKPASLPQSEAERLLGLVDTIELLGSSTVVILNESADSGYPHTRPGRIICMPTSSVIGVSSEALTTTLKHEAMHIHQRLKPQLWNAAAARDGWEAVGAGTLAAAARRQAYIPDDLVNRCRINPDTMTPHRFWAWEGRSVPLPLFLRDDPTSLADVSIRWYDLRSGALLSTPPPTFSVRYGSSPSQPEHPYELLAVEAADAAHPEIRDRNTLEAYLQHK